MTSPNSSESRFFDPRWAASCREAALLLLVAAVATAVTWAFRDDPLPLTADRDFYELEAPAPMVEIGQALPLFDEGDRLFIDSRPDHDAGRTTIPGAFRIRSKSFDDDLYELADIVYPEDPVILFGSGDLRETVFLAELLLARGFEDVLIMRGGVTEWQNQGGEVSTQTTGSDSPPEEES